MLKGILKDGIALVIIQIAGYFLPLISLPYLTRILGKEEFGKYSIIFACVSIIGVFSDFGYVTNGTRRAAIHLDERVYLSNLVKKATSLRVLICLCTLCIFLLFSNRIFGYINEISWISIISVVFSNAIVAPWLIQGMNKLSHYSMFLFFSRVISVMLIFLFVRASTDLGWAIWLNSLPQILSIFYFFWFLRQNSIQWGLSFNLNDIKQEFIEGLHFFIPNAYSILFTNLGIVALGMFQSSSVAGAYSASERLVKAVSSLSGAVNQAVYPRAANEMHKSRSNGVKLLLRISLYVIPIFLVFTLILMLFGPTIIKLVFGDDYFESASVMRYLPLYILLACVNTFMGVIYMTNSGKQKEYGVAFLYGTVVAVLIYFLAPRYISYHAPALGLVIGELTIFATIVYFIRRDNV